MTPAPLHLGLDLGTGGVRALVMSADGRAIASAAQGLAAADSTRDGARHEQSPAAWWSAACMAIRGTLDALQATGGDAVQISALAIDGTSGTLLPVDDAGTPLRWALMYNDARRGAGRTPQRSRRRNLPQAGLSLRRLVCAGQDSVARRTRAGDLRTHALVCPPGRLHRRPPNGRVGHHRLVQCAQDRLRRGR